MFFSFFSKFWSVNCGFPAVDLENVGLEIKDGHHQVKRHLKLFCWGVGWPHPGSQGLWNRMRGTSCTPSDNGMKNVQLWTRRSNLPTKGFNILMLCIRKMLRIFWREKKSPGHIRRVHWFFKKWHNQICLFILCCEMV